MSKIKVKGIKQLVDGTTQPLSIGGVLEDNSDEVLNIASNGDLQVKKVIQTNGIKFPATQVPSADPNTLDDYEEGTFTPVVYGSTVSGIGTYTSQFGEYTKNGNRVQFSLFVQWTAHTGSGALAITLPFPQNSSMETPHAIYGGSNTYPANTYLVASHPATSNFIYPTFRNFTVGTFNSQALISASGYFHISGSYKV